MSKKGVLIIRPLPEPEKLQPAFKPWTRRDDVEVALIMGIPIIVGLAWLAAMMWMCRGG